jgi:hypothetical protein
LRGDDLSGFDGPLVGYFAMSFAYEGDRNVKARLPLAIPQEPRSDRARIRYRLTTDGIDELNWFDWFAAAHSVRDEAQ